MAESKSFLDAVACDNATDGIEAGRDVIVARYRGEPITLTQIEGEPDQYSWDGEDETYATEEEVRQAIRLAERSAESWWAFSPAELKHTEEK